MIFLPDVPGFFFQIRLRSTRTDAAAYCPFLLEHSPSAASILNPLARPLQNKENIKAGLDQKKVSYTIPA